MGLTKDLVTDSLRTVPGEGDLVAAGRLAWVAACDDYASLKLTAGDDRTRDHLDAVAGAVSEAVRRGAEQAGERLASLTIMFVDGAGAMVHTARFTGDAEAPRRSMEPKRAPDKGERPAAAPGNLASIKHVIAVGAGKGGVGKSTIAVSVAVGLARKGHAVGLMDGDIYGPSLPTMLGLGTLEPQVREGRIQPFLVHGVKAVTIGKLVEPDKPLIWRGPMAHGAFKQLAEQTAWGELDYLVIDLPPGTGDVPLTMAQSFQLTGAIIVCTPQRVAQDDAVRAARMFQQLKIEILGVVENMSCFIGDDGKQYDIFGRGGAEAMAQRLGVPFLGAVPITMSLRQNGDDGKASANFEPGEGTAEKRLATALTRLVDNVEAQTNLAAMRLGRSKPKLSIS